MKLFWFLPTYLFIAWFIPWGLSDIIDDYDYKTWVVFIHLILFISITFIIGIIETL